ncbi:MAG: B12-binding domain-containing radical SAM protein, partial [Oscillospiraceae bacterium]|nr:B12-binding domain-containing radical SAM protein [Oscillospiraceae bacterium]
SRVQKVRRTSLTFAPEAGSQRLRDAINKNVREEDVLNSCRVAFEGGWNALKLYFMLGLPTETDEDVIAIAELANHIVYTWRQYSSNKNRPLRVTVSTSFFVPKAHTPFQWIAQIPAEEYMRRVELLRSKLTAKAITYNWHDPETSVIEAVLARGDRRLGAVIENVWKNGGKLDAWGEYFKYDRWTNAFKETGIDPDFYACRDRSRDEVMPWSITSTGVDVDYMWNEYERSKQSLITPDCRAQCTNCGARAIYERGTCDD